MNLAYEVHIIIDRMRIKTVFINILPAFLLSSCMTAITQVPQHLTCIPEQLFRCEPDEKTCMSIPIIKDLGSVEISINLADRKVRSYSRDKTLSHSDIDTIRNENGLIYLNGKGYGYDKTYRAWTAIIDQESGSLYSSSITTGAGHIIYGKCYDKSQ